MIVKSMAIAVVMVLLGSAGAIAGSTTPAKPTPPPAPPKAPVQSFVYLPSYMGM